MSQITFREMYRDVFQTLRGVAETSRREPDAVRSGDERSDANAVRISLSDAAKAVQSKDEAENEVSSADEARMQALYDKKNRARERLIELKKELKLVRKIWQYQPKELTKQLVRLAKALKEVLDQYKSAQKELGAMLKDMPAGNGMAAGAAAPAVAMPAIPATRGAEAPEDEPDPEETDPAVKAEMERDADAAVSAAEAEEAGASAGGETRIEQETPEASTETQHYERARLDDTPYAWELRSDIDFVRSAKGMMTKLKDAFGDVQRWAIGFDQDGKDDRKLYELTGKVLNKLEKELVKYEGDLQRAMPPSIWVMRPVTA